VIADGRPDIFPVNFAVDHGNVVLRTAGGRKLAAARSFPVAFEADGVTEDGQVWSVVVKGGIEPPRHVDHLRDFEEEVAVHPAHSSRKVYQVRIAPDVVTGRRFTPVPASFWEAAE
jgi:nitroimidazol reductase NimA-like FMN-containing flavoprotein (pyridoxamine 5'-phosphate oxidase superfamily)